MPVARYSLSEKMTVEHNKLIGHFDMEAIAKQSQSVGRATIRLHSPNGTYAG
jgi:hypothetical protein